MSNLLFLSHRIPYPPDKGEKIRGWNVLRHLAASFKVHLGCLIDDPADWEHVPLLRTVCAEVAAFDLNKRTQKYRALARLRPGRPLMLDYYHDAGLQSWVDATLARTTMDVIYIYTTAMAPYVLDRQLRGLILDMADIDSEKWTTYARQSPWPMRMVWAREGRTLLAYERKAVLACERTLLVSEPECQRFAELAPESRGKVTWLENGVDLERFSPALRFQTPYAGDGPHIVFTGHMDYWPNADAVINFVATVMPRLRVARPSLQFHIVGANPGSDVRRLANEPGVQVTGRVADVRPYVAHAALSVTPLRIARGIQNKVLEAMAMGRPVVASPQAFEGVRAKAGRDLLVADGADDMARLIGEVLDGGHTGLASAARQAMLTHYAWPAVMRRLDVLLEPPPA